MGPTAVEADGSALEGGVPLEHPPRQEDRPLPNLGRIEDLRPAAQHDEAAGTSSGQSPSPAGAPIPRDHWPESSAWRTAWPPTASARTPSTDGSMRRVMAIRGASRSYAVIDSSQ